mmetsp:Transcript_7944/g.11948  ORF Transcript_7944/g.11948 Transcript_7944/m.11948 type:complete len:159 (-) Transcript_7944:293-769(-)
MTTACSKRTPPSFQNDPSTTQTIRRWYGTTSVSQHNHNVKMNDASLAATLMTLCLTDRPVKLWQMSIKSVGSSPVNIYQIHRHVSGCSPHLPAVQTKPVVQALTALYLCFATRYGARAKGIIRYDPSCNSNITNFLFDSRPQHFCDVSWWQSHLGADN